MFSTNIEKYFVFHGICKDASTLQEMSKTKNAPQPLPAVYMYTEFNSSVCELGCDSICLEYVITVIGFSANIVSTAGKSYSI